MPREPPSWRGVRTIIEGKKAKLILDNDEVIAETVGKLKGGGYFDSNQKPKGDWIITKVTARGTHLWEALDIGEPPEGVAKMLEDHEKLPRLLVGYSKVALEPVFAVGKQPQNGILVVDDLQDLKLETAPGVSICNAQVIPHHSLLIPGNIDAIYDLYDLCGWKAAFARGDLSEEKAKSLAVESIQSLYDGDSPVVVASVQPAAISLVPNHKKPDLRQYHIPGHPRGPGNRRLQEMLPLARDFISEKQVHEEFIYKCPYMSNMRYPKELYEILTNFAREYPYDKFDATAMLFASQLWVDITEHPTRAKEYFIENPLPSVSLSIFLLYFEHWLKIHENFHCLQFAHPFRIMDQMYLKDLCASDHIFHVAKNEIDSVRVRRLVSKAKPRYPLKPVQERVDLFPFMMNGTVMVHPQDASHISRLTPEQQGLIGMPDLRVLGLPSYHCQAGYRRKIAIPKVIANLNFLNNRTENVDLESGNLLKSDHGGPTSLFRDSLKSGTIWTHEFQLYTLPCGLPAAEYIKKDGIAAWNHQVNRRLRWLQTLGVMGHVRLHAGDDGLPGYHGMPLENDGCYLDEASSGRMVQRALEDPRNRPDYGS